MRRLRAILRWAWRGAWAAVMVGLVVLWIRGEWREDHIQTGTLRPQIGLKNYRGRVEIYVQWLPPYVHPAWGKAGWASWPLHPAAPTWREQDYDRRFATYETDWQRGLFGVMVRSGRLSTSGSEVPRFDAEWASVLFPPWLGAAVAAVPVGLAAAGWWRRRRLPKEGHCRQCGYDLRAHAAGQRCPECGTMIERQEVAQ
jgi:hypothetical protein